MPGLDDIFGPGTASDHNNPDSLGDIGGQDPFEQIEETSGGHIPLFGAGAHSLTSANNPTSLDDIIRQLQGNSDFSPAEYIENHPGMTPEEYLKIFASMSDEWAEKYMDYLLEKQSLNEANAYTASREDTAYQRLVNDLQKAGLNPAMMYGSSASISASGSQGYLRQSEGANSRQISNYSKLRNLMLQLMLYSLKANLGTANTFIKGLSAIGSIL